MVTVVDRLNQVASVGNLGETNTEYFAQTFRAAASRLDSVEFFIDTDDVGGVDSTEYRLLVTTVDVSGGFDPGGVLFESALLIDPVDAGLSFTLVKVDTGKLALTPGVIYAFIIDTFVGVDGSPSTGSVGLSKNASTGIDYADGFFASLNVSGGDRATHFGLDWSELSTHDFAFRLTFSDPGVTITGTKGKNTVDATNTVSGQPLPTANDDFISGLGNKDRLSGLGGNDTIDGGKDKDTLFGGDGSDLFLFSVGLKKNPADKIMDFVAVDDTILLAVSKFKGLAQGAVSDAAFRDIGEAASDADRIIYKASGKLLADKDGKGGDDPQAFAKLIGAPDIGAADFLVV